VSAPDDAAASGTPASADDPPAERSDGGSAAETAAIVAFALTRRQRRRSRVGRLGLAAILWSGGLVRYAVDHRLAEWSGWLALIGLAALLALAVVALGAIQPLVALTVDGIVIRYGPRYDRVAWTEITEIEVRERGTARRAVVHRGEARTVLPVPLTGGSLIGPGPDPDLDTKVAAIRQRWRAALAEVVTES
jgi:hypothetical protein